MPCRNQSFLEDFLDSISSKDHSGVWGRRPPEAGAYMCFKTSSFKGFFSATGGAAAPPPVNPPLVVLHVCYCYFNFVYQIIVRSGLVCHLGLVLVLILALSYVSILTVSIHTAGRIHRNTLAWLCTRSAVTQIIS